MGMDMVQFGNGNVNGYCLLYGKRWNVNQNPTLYTYYVLLSCDQETVLQGCGVEVGVLRSPGLGPEVGVIVPLLKKLRLWELSVLPGLKYTATRLQVELLCNLFYN